MAQERDIIVFGGGTGYLGSHLVNMLEEKGFKTVLLVHHNKGSHRLMHTIPISPEGEIDAAGVDANRVLAFINCSVCYGRAGETQEQLMNANCYFPVRFLELAEKMQVPYFLNCMTSIPKDINYYTYTKHMFSEWAKYLVHQPNVHLRFIDCRLEHFYGPHENPRVKFIAYLYDRLKKNLPVPLTVGEQLRDFIYIDDAVHAFELIIRNISLFNEPYQNIDIGSGTPLRIREVATMMRELLQSDSELQFGALPYRDKEIMFSAADTTKLSQLGWQANYSFGDGIKKIIEEEGK